MQDFFAASFLLEVGQIHEKAFFLSMLFAVFTTHAATRIEGTVERQFSERNQFTFELKDTTAGAPLRRGWYRSIRTESPHFNEMFSMVLTSFTAKSRLEVVVVEECRGEIAIIDHVGIH